MSTTLDLTALDRVIGGVRALVHLDATPLMVAWQKIIVDDNRQGVLAGLDKDGVPMAPVKYRPASKPARLTTGQKLGAKGTARGKFGGFGPLASGLHGNLSSGEYRLLGGPPLAPRGRYSRVITNLLTDHAKLREGLWQVTYWWDEVVDVKGNPFLRYHFEGAGRLPRRDLRGLRPAGQAKAQQALMSWARDTLRQAFG
jgi:hypothetical protein